MERRCLSRAAEAYGAGSLGPLSGDSLLGPGTGNAAPEVGEGLSLCCPRWGGAGLFIPGRQGWGLEGSGVGATAPKLCCLLVDSHKRQPKGLGSRTGHTSFFPQGSRQVAFPRDWGRGGGRARPSPRPMLPHGPRIQVAHLQWGRGAGPEERLMGRQVCA